MTGKYKDDFIEFLSNLRELAKTISKTEVYKDYLEVLKTEPLKLSPLMSKEEQMWITSPYYFKKRVLRDFYNSQPFIERKEDLSKLFHECQKQIVINGKKYKRELSIVYDYYIENNYAVNATYDCIIKDILLYTKNFKTEAHKIQRDLLDAVEYKVKLKNRTFLQKLFNKGV